MNPIEELERRIKAKYCGCLTFLDTSGREATFLNIDFKNKSIVVGWRKDIGFGIFDVSTGKGDLPDAAQHCIDEIEQRIYKLMEN